MVLLLAIGRGNEGIKIWFEILEKIIFCGEMRLNGLKKSKGLKGLEGLRKTVTLSEEIYFRVEWV